MVGRSAPGTGLSWPASTRRQVRTRKVEHSEFADWRATSCILSGVVRTIVMPPHGGNGFLPAKASMLNITKVATEFYPKNTPRAAASPILGMAYERGREIGGEYARLDYPLKCCRDPIQCRFAHFTPPPHPARDCAINSSGGRTLPGPAGPPGHESSRRACTRPRPAERRTCRRQSLGVAYLPAPARTADHTLVGLDLDLDEGGFLGAVRRIGLPAASADGRIGRRVELFGALIEPGPLGAAVAGRAALLAALAFRARLCPAVRSCGRKAPSTAPPRSREASQAGLPASRSGSATSSRPCAGGRSPGTAT